MDDEDDDWLVSSDDERGAGESAGLGREAELGMGGRDAAKVKNKMADEGYREGITAGKESTLQQGFDFSFREVGAPLGRRVGNLKGRASALAQFAQGRGSKRQTALPDDVKSQVSQLLKDIEAVELQHVAERDYEAEEHELSHAQEDANVALPPRETAQEKANREAILVRLAQRLDSLSNQVLSQSL